MFHFNETWPPDSPRGSSFIVHVSQFSFTMTLRFIFWFPCLHLLSAGIAGTQYRVWFIQGFVHARQAPCHRSCVPSLPFQLFIGGADFQPSARAWCPRGPVLTFVQQGFCSQCPGPLVSALSPKNEGHFGKGLVVGRRMRAEHLSHWASSVDLIVAPTKSCSFRVSCLSTCLAL